MIINMYYILFSSTLTLTFSTLEFDSSIIVVIFTFNPQMIQKTFLLFPTIIF